MNQLDHICINPLIYLSIHFIQLSIHHPIRSSVHQSLRRQYSFSLPFTFCSSSHSFKHSSVHGFIHLQVYPVYISMPINLCFSLSFNTLIHKITNPRIRPPAASSVHTSVLWIHATNNAAGRSKHFWAFIQLTIYRFINQSIIEGINSKPITL